MESIHGTLILQSNLGKKGQRGQSVSILSGRAEERRFASNRSTSDRWRRAIFLAARTLAIRSATETPSSVTGLVERRAHAARLRDAGTEVFHCGGSTFRDGPTPKRRTVDVLLRNLRGLSLSSGGMPPITLISTESSSADAVNEIANTVGAAHRKWDAKAPVQPEPGQLTIVVVPG